MAFENLDMNDGLEKEETPAVRGGGEPTNRTFMIAAGVLGGITLLALLMFAVYVALVLPGQKEQKTVQAATVMAQNTAIAKAITQTSAAMAVTPTSAATNTPLPVTPTPTNTAVVALPTNTVAPTDDPRTPTVAALLTQAAVSTRTVIPTSTALPETGFAEDVGLPGMMGMAVLLVGIIFLARRLRLAD